jgi:hypothetical protein
MVHRFLWASPLPGPLPLPEGYPVSHPISDASLWKGFGEMDEAVLYQPWAREIDPSSAGVIKSRRRAIQVPRPKERKGATELSCAFSSVSPE